MIENILLMNEKELGQLVRDELREFRTFKRNESEFRRINGEEERVSYPVFDPYQEFSYQNEHLEVGGQVCFLRPIGQDCHTADCEPLVQMVPPELLDPAVQLESKMKAAIKQVIDQEMANLNGGKP